MKALLLSGLLLTSIVLACGSKVAPSSGQVTADSIAAAAEPAGVSTPIAADETCDRSDQCLAVEVACCDHCNGGAVKAFNKGSAAKHAPKDCEGARCTKMGCAPATVSCVDHRCVISSSP